GQVRYGLLETLRQYAAEKLREAGEARRYADRHLAWALELAERAAPALSGPDQNWWLATLEREAANLRGALRWSVPATPVRAGTGAGAAAEAGHDSGGPVAELALGGGRAAAGLRLAVASAYFWEIRGHLYRSEGLRWLEEILAAHALDEQHASEGPEARD